MIAKRIPCRLFLICSILLWANQAFSTATTHIWAPSTDIQGFKVLHLTNDLYFPVENDAYNTTVTNVGLTMGILPTEKYNLEIGLDHKTGLGTADAYPIYLNAKFGTPEGAFIKNFPALAFGIFDLGTKSDVTDYNVIYGKLAKTISGEKFNLGRISIGFFFGDKDLLGKDENAGILAAWERTINEISDKMWLCVEYMEGKSVYGTLNIGLSWKFADKMAVIAGFDIYNNRDFADTATLQADIDFPLK